MALPCRWFVTLLIVRGSAHGSSSDDIGKQEALDVTGKTSVLPLLFVGHLGADLQQRRAAKEIRRFIYELTDSVLPVLDLNDSASANATAGAAGVIIGTASAGGKSTQLSSDGARRR